MSQPDRDARPAWSRLHLWQIQPVRDVLVVLTVFGLLGLGSALSLVTSPLLLAILFAYLCEPLIVRMSARRWLSRRMSVVGLIFAGVALIVVPALLGLTFGVVQAVRLGTDVAEDANAVIASVQSADDVELRAAVDEGFWLDARDWLVRLRAEIAAGKAEEEARALSGAAEGTADAPEGGSVSSDGEIDVPLDSDVKLLGIEASDLDFVGTRVLLWLEAEGSRMGQVALNTGADTLIVALSTVTSVGKLAFGLFLTLFFFFFVSSGWNQVTRFGHGLIPDKHKEKSEHMLGRMDRVISGFIRGRLTVAFILALVYTVGFALIGVPAPLLLGPFVALLSLVPYAAVLGLPVAIVLMFLDAPSGFRGEWWWIVFAPIGFYNIGQALDDYVLTPAIQGKTTDLATPTILFASIAGGVLAGFYGLLVAIPAAACVKILLDEVFWPRFKGWIHGEEADFLPLED